MKVEHSNPAMKNVGKIEVSSLCPFVRPFAFFRLPAISFPRRAPVHPPRYTESTFAQSTITGILQRHEEPSRRRVADELDCRSERDAEAHGIILVAGQVPHAIAGAA